MEQLISTSINGLISVAVSENVTKEQYDTIMEVVGTLQGILILNNRKDRKTLTP